METTLQSVARGDDILLAGSETTSFRMCAARRLKYPQERASKEIWL
ncbi:MAG: hypothetical protein LBT24_06855 [Tannerella sp.]|nr:hypothetical protein [Tannerella sp.]